MFDEFTFDLKVARKRAGLTQVDCGHLLGASDNVISQLERGQRLPTLRELCSLSLIYGRSFECLYADLLRDVRKVLTEQLGSMPEAPKGWPAEQARQRTLERLARRLREESDASHGA
ncbi:helix-turn-helix transcriptional regulator [Marimonas sp. MJW-29]|uniref:Helix-turn-helix transcriptional regulator n=1 Tax=Sulfitobacter sediminis TaxID=3234186 RepID=A0ABV3RP73_9RHOB